MSNSKLIVTDSLWKLASSGEKSLEWFRDVENSMKIQAYVEVATPVDSDALHKVFLHVEFSSGFI